MTYTPSRCPWCGPAALADSDPDPTTLCLRHYAEYAGLSIAEVERMDAEHTAEVEDLA